MNRLCVFVGVVAPLVASCAPEGSPGASDGSAVSQAFSVSSGVVCGDGRRMNGEECDDGNQVDGDGCSSTCLAEELSIASSLVGVCGNGHHDKGEGCDDGNLTSGDGCDAACHVEPGYTCTSEPLETGFTISICAPNPPGCGDAVRSEEEECDDGNLASGDGCDEACAIEAGFSCEGEVGELSTCRTPGCGNGLLIDPEACDDGNQTDGDGCSASCTVEAGYTCRAVLTGDVGSPLISVCEPGGACGDGVWRTGEECDDGNGESGDGCSEECMLEPGFTCFSVRIGPPMDAPPSYTRCEPRGCGDGMVNDGEECDDWNLESGDGCSSACELELGFVCDEHVVTALPEILGLRTVDCAAPGICGDAVVTAGEVCDHGAANGLAGFCNVTCSAYLLDDVVNVAPYELASLDGRVGLIIGETDLTPLCLADFPGVADFGELQDMVRDNGFFAGRIARATEDFIVENPLVFLRIPEAGASVLTGRREDVAPLYGHFSVQAGSAVVFPITTSIAPGSCPCSAGSVFAQDACNTIDGPVGGTGPCGCPECGETAQCGSFRTGASLRLDLGDDLPLEGRDGDRGAIHVSCDSSCLIAGPTTSCTEPGGSPVPVDDGLLRDCAATPPRLDRVCTQIGLVTSTLAGGSVEGCPGMCSDGTSCGWLGPVEGTFNRCQIQSLTGDPGPGEVGGACDLTQQEIDAIMDDLEHALPEDIWKVCIDNGHPLCIGLDGRREPLEDEDEHNLIMCAAAQDEGDPRQCIYCSRKLGGGCVGMDGRDALDLPGVVVNDTLERLFPDPTDNEMAERARAISEQDIRQAQIGLRANEGGPEAQGENAQKKEETKDLDPVAIATGELTMEVTDVAFPSRGVPFELVRSYRSGGMARSGAFGPGWTHNYEERVEAIGDPYNRDGVPSYCVNGLSTAVRCLLHHDGRGGSQMYILDPDSLSYVPLPGSLSVIRALRTVELLELVEAPAGTAAWALTEPGGVTKTFDFAGVLLSVKDDKGFGVELEWRLRSVDDVQAEGNWASVLPRSPWAIDRRSLAAGMAFRDRANRLNRLELTGARDSYGRSFKFAYVTEFRDVEPTPDGPYRRRRLEGVGYRGERLVSYEYTQLDVTNEAYLERVTRSGMAKTLPAAQATVTEYEYQHDVFDVESSPAGALATKEEPGGALVGMSPFAEEVLARLDEIAVEVGGCMVELALDPELDRHACGVPIIPAAGLPSGFTGHPIFRALRGFIADNIVRVRRSGGPITDIELESAFEVDPFSADFDRVVAQRYGALATELTTPAVIEQDPGGLVHRWLTDAPTVFLRQSGTKLDGSLPLGDVPPEVRGAAPPVGHAEYQSPSGAALPEECTGLHALDALPLFAIHEPVGPRMDEDLSAAVDADSMLRSTTAGCPAVAARHARDPFLNDIRDLGPDAPLSGKRREALSWDLALVCRWVEVTDRIGARSYRGTNFAGQVLVEAVPSPEGTGYAITKRLFNADGMIAEEIFPDGGRLLTSYAGEDGDPSAPLFRGLATRVVQVAATSASLVPATVPGSFGLEHALSEREWTFTYEPLFQQLASATDPTGQTELRLYDYQQLAPSDALAHALVERASRLFSSTRPPQFLGRDLDGDGRRTTEDSAGLVVTYAPDVPTGTGTFDVGQRLRRDGTGRVSRTTNIVDVFDPDDDTDATDFRYYEDLDKAEAGDISIDEACEFPRGPLGLEIRRRAPGTTSTDDLDLDVDHFAYDALGGVRLWRKNEDASTDVVTRRSALGQVIEVERPGISLVAHEHDRRGQLVRSRSVDLTGAAEPRTTTYAWAGAGVPLGACTDIFDGACGVFPGFALALAYANARGTAEPARLFGASYSVTLLDPEDRTVGAIDAADGRVDLALNAAGFVSEQQLQAAPPIPSLFRYDEMGRLVREAHGDGGEAVETSYRYDRLGRLRDVQTLGELGAGFQDGVGTISTAKYDRVDRAIRHQVVGDDGRGTRRVLAAQAIERNPLGAELLVHHLAGAQPVGVPTPPTAIASDDGWASEELRYDHALRAVFHSAEGRGVETRAAYDGFGVREMVGPHASVRIDEVPRSRTRTTHRLGAAEGPSAQIRELRQVSTFDVRGLLVESQVSDVTAAQADPGNAVERISRYRYDGLGQLRESVDASGRTKFPVPDRAGRVVAFEERSPAGTLERRTEYDHDSLGRVVAERPAQDAPETLYLRDRAGRVVGRSSGAGLGGRLEEIGYDSAGRTSSIVVRAARTRTTRFAFEVGATRPSSIRVDGLLAKHYTRDGLLRPVVATDTNLVLPQDGGAALRSSRPVLATTLRFDTLGRVVQDATTGDFPASSPTLPGTSDHVLALLTRAWGDDLLGPESVTTLRGDSLSFGYSERGTLESVVRDTAGTVHAVAMSSEGGLWVRAEVAGRGLWEVTKTRDAFGFVAGNSLSATGSAASFDDVLRGPTGKITAERRQGPRLGSRARGFSYDGLGRLDGQREDHRTLISAATFVASAAAAARDEDAGMLVVSAPDNVSTSTLTDADAITQSSEDIHRRSFQSVVDDTAAGVPALDVNGRDIRQDALQRTGDDGALSYTFDALDRLVLVNRASQEELRLAYDGVGRRRLERRQMLGGHVEDAVLEYDGPNVIEESDVETGGLYVATTHAPGVDAPLLVTLAEGRATPTFILRTNARGDAVAAGEDETGQIVEEADLSAWGEREIAARAGEPCVEGAEGRDGPRRISLPVGVCALHSRVLGRFGIGGARAHPGTKLVDLRNRVYAPHLRAFLTRDPLGTVDAQGLYAYAGDPINLRDPWGLTKGQEAANQGPEIGPDDPVWEYVDTPSGEKETTVGARRKNQGPAGGCANNPQECLESRERERQEQLERTQGRGEAQRRAVEDRGAPDGGGGDDEADFLRRHPFIGGFMYGFAQVPLPRPAPPPPRPQRIAKLGYGGPSGIVDEVVRALGGRICNSSYCPTVGETAVLVAMTVASTRSDARPPNLSPLGVGRRGAFNAAKRDSGIPTSQQPSVVRPNVDRRGNEQPGRVYEFEVPSPGGGPPRTVTIRDDVGGHVFPDDPGQDRGPHFNTEGGGHYEY